MSAVKPLNILIFMTDQQRGDSILPEHPARTPVLDRFLAEGLCFTDARCPAPHCCPSRATFFSGLWPSEHGVWNNVCVQNALSRGPRAGVRLWSEELAAAGWRLRFDGKWHVSYETGPREHGWEEGAVTAPPGRDRAYVMGRDWDGYARLPAPPAVRGPGAIVRPGYDPYVHYGAHDAPHGDAGTVAAACEALAGLARGGAPWCHYIGINGPHDPYYAPQRLLDLYPELPPLPASFADRMADKPGLYRRTRARFDQLPECEHREAIRAYWAFCTYVDELFGRVLATLAATGQAEDTVVIYCSDHGDYAGEHGLWCKGLPCFRGAYQVPLAVRWPRGLRRAGRRVAAPVQLADLANTVRELAGLPAGPGSGRSLVPFLHDRAPAAWRRLHATQSNGNELYGIQRSVDDGRWKYVWNGFDEDELYDLAADPHEMRNLARDPAHAEVVARQCARLWAFARAHDDACINGYIMTGLAPVGPGAAFADGVPLPHEG